MHQKLSLSPRSIRITLAAAAVLALLIAGMGKLTKREVGAARSRDRVESHAPQTRRGPSVLEPLPEPVRRLMHESRTPSAGQRDLKGIDSLPETEQVSLGRALSDARHKIHPMTDGQQSLPGDEDALYRASSHSQRLFARFLDKGLRLIPMGSEHAWSGMIGLDSANGNPQLVQEGTVLQYRHAEGVTEWFDNQPNGIEHGFIVHEDSTLRDGTRLKIPVRLENLRAEATANGSDLNLLNPEGETLLTYQKLQVWDADGVELAAHMTPTSNGLEISVEARGARYPVVIDPLIISQEAKQSPKTPPTSADGTSNDSFGYSVSLSGDTALVGALNDRENNVTSGSAYVLVRSGSTWSAQQQLLPTGATIGGAVFFGFSVSISGNTAVIGAYKDDSNNKGRAYVFVRSGTTWTQQVQLAPADRAMEDWFGYSVCIEGETALIGSPQDDDKGDSSGSVYVYVRSGTTWSIQQKLVSSATSTGEKLGTTMSLSGDTALLGVPNARVALFQGGAAYVFVRSGTTWSQQQKLFRPDGAEGDKFGASVSVLNDTALIGVPSDDDKGDNSGSAYVYVRNGTTWDMQKKLLAYDGASYAYFGSAVSLSSDAALVGARGDTTNGCQGGSAYPFWRLGNVLSQQRKLTASDAATGDYFGWALCLSGDTALIGAYGDDGVNYQGGVADTLGAVYLFRISMPNFSTDSDADGLPDAFETGTGTYFSPDDTGSYPNKKDSDDDGLSDGDEVNLYGTDPNDVDSDDDGYYDGAEVAAGSNPTNASVTPNSTVFTLVDGFSLSVVSRRGCTYRVEGYAESLIGTGEVFHDNLPGTGKRIYPFVNRAQGENKQFWKFIETKP
jgi:hypothetical protein